MRSILEDAQQAAAEVDAVDLHIAWCMRDDKGGQQRTQQRTLARLRRADNRQVAAQAREVENHRLLLLRCGSVEHTNGCVQLIQRRS